MVVLFHRVALDLGQIIKCANTKLLYSVMQLYFVISVSADEAMFGVNCSAIV